MIRGIFFLPSAIADVEQAVQWYDRQVPGLGRAYGADLHFQLNRISQFPDLFPRWNRVCRRSCLRRFPYTIIYSVRPADIEIVAVQYHRNEADAAQEATGSR